MTGSLQARSADRFLRGAALFMLVYAVSAFTLRAATNMPTMDRAILPLVALHAVLMTAWLAMFYWQVRLRQSGRIAVHRGIGPWLGILGGAVVGIGLVVSYTSAREFEMPLLFYLNGYAFVAFAMLVALAIRKAGAGNFAAHKRLMFLATLTFLGPASARFLSLLGLPAALAPLFLLTFIIALPYAYDRLDVGRWTATNRNAALIYIAGLAAAIGLGATSFGAAVIGL